MASNLPTSLSPRARKVLDLMADGAEFVKRLESNSYTGRATFQHRVVASGQVVKGYGCSVFYELYHGGWLVPGMSTSVSTYYKLNKGAA